MLIAEVATGLQLFGTFSVLTELALVLFSSQDRGDKNCATKRPCFVPQIIAFAHLLLFLDEEITDPKIIYVLTP